MTQAENRPNAVTIAGALLLVAGMWSLMLAVGLTIGSFFMWVPAYTCGIVCASWSGLVGILLLAGVKTGRVIPITACIGEMILIVDCDGIGLVMGVIALVMITQPDATAWLIGHAAPGAFPQGQAIGRTATAAGQATGEPATGVPATGFEVTSVHNPLAFALLLTHPVLTIDGVPHNLRWGLSFVAAEPGMHRIHMHYPYLFMDGNPVTTDLTVHEGYVTQLRYSAPIFVFQAGLLTETGHQPLVAALPEPQPPQDPGLPQPPGPA